MALHSPQIRVGVLRRSAKWRELFVSRSFELYMSCDCMSTVLCNNSFRVDRMVLDAACKFDDQPNCFHVQVQHTWGLEWSTLTIQRGSSLNNLGLWLSMPVSGHDDFKTTWHPIRQFNGDLQRPLPSRGRSIACSHANRRATY